MIEDPRWPRASRLLDSGVVGEAGEVHVVGVPLSQASISPSGAHETPSAVRVALRRFSSFAALPADLGGLVDLTELTWVDRGDLPVHDLPVEQAQAEVEAALTAAAGVPDLLVLLGGDNAVTYPAVRALGPLDRVGVLTLDAHHDIRGDHAGVTNGTPIRQLLEDGLQGAHVAQVGIGAFTNSAAYRADIDAAGVTVVGVADARAEGVAGCVRRLLDELAARCDVVHVDLDVDVLDRAYAPGCPGARPGGLHPDELLAAAVEAGRHASVASLDVTEVDATADRDGITVDVAALCLLHAAAGVAQRPRP